MPTPKIKICGLTDPKEASYLNEAKVDYAGFVFYEKSKRNINVEKAKEIFASLDDSIKKVAVMVSPSKEDIIEKNENGFDIVQIHKELKKEVLEASTLPVWYAINIEDEDEANRKMEYLESFSEELRNKIEAIVVDAPVFGSGKTFNWKKSKRLLKAGAQSPPTFVLAGGLNALNVEEGINIFGPDVVDVSSGVESEIVETARNSAENEINKTGKDRQKILDFVAAVRNTKED
ncbi:MAG: phosphoribosylanthranilate isomerase [Lachnospiraceae bacterium]|nr:phosphoribosylanthranilate isomerase [Lachnospiraceae bacterium]